MYNNQLIHFVVFIIWCEDKFKLAFKNKADLSILTTLCLSYYNLQMLALSKPLI